MLSLLVVLFFSVTGITLNHPEWIFGTEITLKDYTGTMPKNWLQNGKVDWLTTAETLRAKYNLKGRVSDNRSDDQQASISFRAPGYGADGFINMADGTYKLTVNAQGAVAVLNDLHRGRDAGKAWAWLIRPRAKVRRETYFPTTVNASSTLIPYPSPNIRRREIGF